MSKKSEAKERQGYVRRPKLTNCGTCENFRVVLAASEEFEKTLIGSGFQGTVKGAFNG